MDVVVIASWNADLSLYTARPPVRGETVMGEGFTIGPGGKGSNAAVAAARQGARVAVVASIGHDDFGRMALDLWQREGIDTQAVRQLDGVSSGVAQIMIFPDGDNSIVVSAGANAALDAAQVRAAAVLRTSRVVVGSFEVPLPAVEEAFRLARTAGVRTLLNPAPARVLSPFLCPLIDVVTPNRTEVCALAGLPADADPQQAAQILTDHGVGAVIVTEGPRGATLYRQGRAAHRVPGWPVRVVDTVGAGDTFTGALAAALAAGDELEAALRWANASAALSVQGRGALGGMPTRAAVSDWLATQNDPPAA